MPYILYSDQNYFEHEEVQTYFFERYSKGPLSHDAMRAYTNDNAEENESYLLDITALGSETGALTGKSGFGTNAVCLRMFARTGDEFRERYQQRDEEIGHARVSPRNLWIASVCIFVQYLNRGNGNYSFIGNNCKHYCNTVIETINRGELSMPDGYVLEEDPNPQPRTDLDRHPWLAWQWTLRRE